MIATHREKVGESALQAVRDLRPEVLLLDVQLPGIDGFEVAARLTAEGDAPAIVMSSNRGDWAASGGCSAGRSSGPGCSPGGGVPTTAVAR